MIELREVDLKRIHPNPWREGALDPERVAAHKASLKEDGQYAPLPARQRRDGEYEIAYGHHRLEAMKQLGWKQVQIMRCEFTDEEMLDRLASENDEVWNHDFLSSTLMSVRSYLKAYEEGVIDLTPKHAGEKARCTTRFEKPYTAQSLAEHRGGAWLDTKGSAQDKVEAAVALINEALVPDSQLAKLGPTQVRTILEAARAAKRSREAAAISQTRIYHSAAEKAQKDGYDDKAAEYRDRIVELDAKVEKDATKAAKEAAKQAVALLHRGESVRAIREALVPKMQKKGSERVAKAEKATNSEAYTAPDYTMAAARANLQRTQWETQTPRILAGRSEVGKKDLKEALTRLAGQVSKLAKEL